MFQLLLIFSRLLPCLFRLLSFVDHNEAFRTANTLLARLTGLANALKSFLDGEISEGTTEWRIQWLVDHVKVVSDFVDELEALHKRDKHKVILGPNFQEIKDLVVEFNESAEKLVSEVQEARQQTLKQRWLSHSEN